MSIMIDRKRLREEDMDEFEKKLVVVETKVPSCPWILPTKTFLVEYDEHRVYLPFQWGVQYYGKSVRAPRDQCQCIKIPFQASLRPLQTEIVQEATELLNRQGSALLAMYPGAGKCLARGTRVLSICRCYSSSFSYRWKRVECVQEGDLLVGDDARPRKVSQCARGREPLFRIAHAHFPEWIYYDVNESHILTLFSKRDGVLVDLPLVQYLAMSEHRRQAEVCGVVRRMFFFDFRPGTSPVEFDGGYPSSTKMVVTVPMDNDDEKESDRQEGKGRGLVRRMLASLLLRGAEILGIRRVVEYGRRRWEISFQVSSSWKEDDDRSLRHLCLYPLRVDARTDSPQDYFGFRVDGNGRFLLWDGTVTHNTITSLALSSHIGLRTMILVNKLVLIEQWVATLKTAFGDHVRYQVVKSRQALKEGCQFYLMNAINVAKRDRAEYCGLRIGLVIVDECHLIMTRLLSKSLSFFQPRYLIGLSATPFRPDGFDVLLDLNFGPKKIVRKLHRAHQVYLVSTPLQIRAENTSRGKILWNSVIDQQCDNPDRNAFIVRLCQTFTDRKILILSKRCRQIEWLCAELLRVQEDVTCMKQNDTTFDPRARILIATFQKVGTGFSHDQLDMLILATDAEEYFIQYLGRVFRTPDVVPLIIDIVDRHPLLRKHFLTRKKVYLEAGGTLDHYPYESVPPPSHHFQPFVSSTHS